MNTLSTAYFEKAKELIPGGVNSPVRAFKSVGGNPVFIKSAKGAYLHDVDGNSYIDLIGSWGPLPSDWRRGCGPEAGVLDDGGQRDARSVSRSEGHVE